MNKYFLFMFTSVVLSSVSQILLKISARREHDSFWTEYINPYVIIGYALMIAATLTTILAYRGMEYKNGPVIESLGYILVMLLSYYILKEKISPKKLVGYGLILIGVVVFYI